MFIEIMFKDYYLILGISSDANPKEIEKAFKDAGRKNNLHGIISMDSHDIQEAFQILSDPELKILYDKELEAYNASGDFDNYTIQDSKLEDKISSLQGNIAENTGDTSGCGSKIGKGCMWAVIVVIVIMLQMCITAIMKEKGRNDVRNRYSYFMPYKTTNDKPCSRTIINYCTSPQLQRMRK